MSTNNRECCSDQVQSIVDMKEPASALHCDPTGTMNRQCEGSSDARRLVQKLVEEQVALMLPNQHDIKQSIRRVGIACQM